MLHLVTWNTVTSGMCIVILHIVSVQLLDVH